MQILNSMKLNYRKSFRNSPSYFRGLLVGAVIGAILIAISALVLHHPNSLLSGLGIFSPAIGGFIGWFIDNLKN